MSSVAKEIRDISPSAERGKEQLSRSAGWSVGYHEKASGIGFND